MKQRPYRFTAAINRSAGYSVIRRSDRYLLGYVKAVRKQWEVEPAWGGAPRLVASRNVAAEYLMEACPHAG